MKIFIATRKDENDWDECVEQTIIAKDKEEALKLANKEYGVWKLVEISTKESKILTKSFIWG